MPGVASLEATYSSLPAGTREGPRLTLKDGCPWKGGEIPLHKRPDSNAVPHTAVHSAGEMEKAPRGFIGSVPVSALPSQDSPAGGTRANKHLAV